MISKDKLIEAFERNLGIIQSQTEGLTDVEALLLLPFRANCLNWVLGHIIFSRDDMLDAMGFPQTLTAEQKAIYEYGSEPVTKDSDSIIPMSQLLELLARQQEELLYQISKSTEDQLNTEVNFAGSPMKLTDLIFFLYFHETYHTGQLEYLRQLAGKDDHII